MVAKISIGIKKGLHQVNHNQLRLLFKSVELNRIIETSPETIACIGTAAQ